MNIKSCFSKNEEGFILLEVFVALFILGITFASLTGVAYISAKVMEKKTAAIETLLEDENTLFQERALIYENKDTF